MLIIHTDHGETKEAKPVVLVGALAPVLSRKLKKSFIGNSVFMEKLLPSDSRELLRDTRYDRARTHRYTRHDRQPRDWLSP